MWLTNDILLLQHTQTLLACTTEESMQMHSGEQRVLYKMYYGVQTVQARVHQADQVLAVSDLQTVNIALEASESVSCLSYFAGMSSLLPRC